MVKIHCLGGFREVGRNAVLVEGKTEKILFEYGVKVESGEMPLPLPAKPDALFITHGHLDHFGSAPTLFKKWSLPVYGAAPTKDDAELLLKDSMKIADIKQIPQKYTANQMRNLLSHWHPVRYNRHVNIGKSKVDIYTAGHVPGSCFYLLTIDGKRILYTGDFKLDPTRIVEGANVNVGKIDTLIMETTYSSREHPPRHKEEKQLGDIVNRTIERGGIAVLPVFALRAADILLVLHNQKIKAPIYLDGMAKKATQIMIKHPQFTRNSVELKKALSKVTNLHRDDERIKAISKPCVIVTTGGNMDGGPIVLYLKHLYARQDCSLIMTGFQSPKTAGRYLVDTGRYVANGMDLKLKMQFHKLDFSGHAGRDELLRFVKKIRPKKVLCMHGEYCERFATELKGRFSIDAVAPKNGDVLFI